MITIKSQQVTFQHAGTEWFSARAAILKWLKIVNK